MAGGVVLPEGAVAGGGVVGAVIVFKTAGAAAVVVEAVVVPKPSNFPKPFTPFSDPPIPPTANIPVVVEAPSENVVESESFFLPPPPPSLLAGGMLILNKSSVFPSFFPPPSPPPKSVVPAIFFSAFPSSFFDPVFPKGGTIEKRLLDCDVSRLENTLGAVTDLNPFFAGEPVLPANEKAFAPAVAVVADLNPCRVGEAYVWCASSCSCCCCNLPSTCFLCSTKS